MALKPNEPISVVVPVFQEGKNLPEFLAALQAQTLLPNEIIFVEAGSTDESPSLLKKWTKTCLPRGPAVQILRNPGGFPGANRNRGVEKSRHPWMAFLDVRTIPRPEWLETMKGLRSTGTEEAWLGKCRMDGDNAFAKAVCAVSYGCGTDHPTLPGSMFHRKVFETIGGFREDLRSGEDIDWLKKLRHSGLEIGCRDLALIRYEGFPRTGSGLRKKYLSYSRCGVRIGHHRAGYLFFALFFPFLAGLLLLQPIWGLGLTFGYLLGRGVLDPARRSRAWLWWRPFGSALFWAPWVAVQIDSIKAWAFFSTRRRAT